MDYNEDLYREIILDHDKNPRNFGPLSNATHQASGINENCGDQLTIHAYINEGVAENIKFEGEGCTLCKASASLMTFKLKGQSLSNIFQETSCLEALLVSQEEPTSQQIEKLGDSAALLGVRQPQRIRCVLLAWDTLRNALK